MAQKSLKKKATAVAASTKRKNQPKKAHDKNPRAALGMLRKVRRYIIFFELAS